MPIVPLRNLILQSETGREGYVQIPAVAMVLPEAFTVRAHGAIPLSVVSQDQFRGPDGV